MFTSTGFPMLRILFPLYLLHSQSRNLRSVMGSKPTLIGVFPLSQPQLRNDLRMRLFLMSQLPETLCYSETHPFENREARFLRCIFFASLSISKGILLYTQ